MIECVKITNSIQTITIDGVRVEAKAEEEGLRLFKAEILDNLDEQHQEVVQNVMNEVKYRLKDLT